MKILIIEDEAAAARRLQKMLLELDSTIEIIAHLESIEATVEWFGKGNTTPDLAFMDIHLADGSCFEIFAQTDVSCPVIFATAYDQYAIQAFKVNVIDYLLKPIKKEELTAALQKFQRLHTQPQLDYSKVAEAILKRSVNEKKRLVIRLGQTIKVIDYEDVAYFYTQDKITFAVTNAGKRYPLDFSIDRLEELCDPTIFFRINRQFVININGIKEMHAYSKSRVKIELLPPTDQDTIVSTERSSKFKKWLEGDAV